MVVCINEFADTFNLNYREAFNYLKQYNAIKFLKDNYEIEHTLSIEEAREKDVLGRVYEYFLGKFAANEGKGEEEFYTPKGIVKLMVEMVEPKKLL